MSIHKLSSTDAFVAFDLDGVPSTGVVRSAPKILQGGAKDMARSLTYAFATLEMQRGGASAGVNARPEDRDAALNAFVEELTPMVSDGSLSLDAGKGVGPGQLEALSAMDDRSDVAGTDHDGDPLSIHLAGLGPVVAAANAIGGLDGKSVAIEGFGANGAALASAAAARGASITAFSTAKGSLSSDSGFSADELRGLWQQNGDAMVGDDADPAWKVFSVEADVMFAGSKLGAINHDTAANLNVAAVVPHGPLPYTARALAVMERGGIIVLPDFITTAAPLMAAWPAGDASPGAVISSATAAVESALDDTAEHSDGRFLGACYRAEAYLGTWRDSLPFGRPLAS